MKIGFISDKRSDVVLFKFLAKYSDIERLVHIDHRYGYRGDQNISDISDHISSITKNMIDKGCDYIILPPAWEIYMTHNNIYIDHIVNLFNRYIHDHVYRYSLVGKLGLLGDRSTISYISQLYDTNSDILGKYEPNQYQSSNKKFGPRQISSRDTVMWKYMIQNISSKSWMINNMVKNDIRYMHNANVDTLVPLERSYMNIYTNIIHHARKIKFHDIADLELSRHSWASDHNLSNTVYIPDHKPNIILTSDYNTYIYDQVNIKKRLYILRILG